MSRGADFMRRAVSLPGFYSPALDVLATSQAFSYLLKKYHVQVRAFPERADLS